MTELIHVDFKARQVTGRRDITPVPVGEWKAAKDPIFKDYVAGLAMAAEAFHAMGGDWTRAVIVMSDPSAGEDGATFTIWDSNIQTNEEVSDALMIACSKVDIDGESGDEPA
ncbi:hypothetical protein CNR34_00009 [Pseudomonas phage nickie]|uniref:Uncharacterized protein n=1 Tax=Pseudomonas phage nickie TaxID=2048977 RepID=A0A2H4P6Y3_9CAUD|nr:hypothetical protein FDJ16_gp156 [Pseudomonas phage nickie]ATW57942.1 hypothetical protein CNR34_00009 [Pseudomonas phage nickie]